MIDGRNYFDQPIKNYLKTYGNIKKIATIPPDVYQNIPISKNTTN